MAAAAHRVIGSTQVTLSQEGASVTRGNETVFKNWTEVIRPTASSNHGFLYLSADDVVIIPSRCFSDPKEFEMFMMSAIIFQWNCENALKAAEAAATKNPTPEPSEIKRMVIPMLAAAKDSGL